MPSMSGSKLARAWISDRVNKGVLSTVLVMLLPLAMVLGLANGAVSVPFDDLLRALFSSTSDSRDSLIINQIRLPRVALAAMIGAILAISGAAMQGLFRNPLADPSLIGVTAGASLGASVAIVVGSGLGQGIAGLGITSLGAFLGGIASVIFVYRLATSETGTSVATMLLAGIAITALAGSLTSLLEFYADNHTLRRISLWRMGGLDGANMTRVQLAAVICVLLLVVLPRFSSALNALLLGESEARHLGIDVDKVKRWLVVWTALAVGVSVALAGTIAFVGLIVPHIVRMLTGPDHRLLLPLSALAGAILLVLADTVSRTLLAPTELPIGIVTALLGVPFFVSLLRQRRQYGMQ